MWCSKTTIQRGGGGGGRESEDVVMIDSGGGIIIIGGRVRRCAGERFKGCVGGRSTDLV